MLLLLLLAVGVVAVLEGCISLVVFISRMPEVKGNIYHSSSII